MTTWLLEGKMRSGKSLAAVWMMRKFLAAGKRVATNLDIDLGGMFPSSRVRREVVRLPDKPRTEDFVALGTGYDLDEEYDEEKFGLIVLDELGSWLNSREWGDKDRQGAISWLSQSGKAGWHVIFIAQSIEMIDKQIRSALIEYRGMCRRMDRLRIPFLSDFVESLTLGYVKGNLPRIHVVALRYGIEANAFVSERWVFKGRDLWRAYDTRQKIGVRQDREMYCPVPSQWFDQPDVRISPLARLIRAIRASKTPPRPARPPHRLIALLRRLPPDEAMRHYRRLDALGAFG